MSERQGLVLEVFADIWCPFAYVGLRITRLELERAGRDDVAIHVRAWPLELVNGTPLDPLTTMEHAEELRDQVAPELFRGLAIDRFPTSTLAALALANRAYRVDLMLGEQVSFGLRTALFEEGRDISDLAILEELAQDFGMAPPDEADRASVIQDWHEGQRRGVLGSPHLFYGEMSLFCPSLHIAKSDDGGLKISRDISRIAAFLAECTP